MPSRVVPVNLFTDKSIGKPQDFLIPASLKPFWCLSLNFYNFKFNPPFSFNLPKDASWVKANLGGSGFYRVNYPMEVSG